MSPDDMPAAQRDTICIDDLPEEILSRILTISFETSADPLVSDTDVDYTPARLARRMRKSLRPTALVSKRWWSILFSKSNYHFWVTNLFISAVPSATTPEDIADQLAKFKDNLEHSLGSDLSVTCHWMAGTWELSTLDRCDILNRLLTHSLGMLIPYQHQLVAFNANVEGDTSCSMLLTFLSGLTRATRLTRVNIHYMTGMSETKIFPQTTTHDFDLEVPVSNRGVDLENSLSGLISMHICGILLWRNIILPSSLQALTIMWSTLPSQRTTLSDVMEALCPMEYLQWLNLGPVYFSTPPNFVPERKYHLRRLKNLSMETDVATVVMFFSSIEFEELSELNVSIEAVGTPLNPLLSATPQWSRKGLQRMSLSLKYGIAEGETLELLRCLDCRDLESLNINSYNILSHGFGVNKIKHFTGARSVHLSASSPAATRVLMRYLDMQYTETLSLSAGPAELSSDEMQQDSFDLPQLRSLTCDILDGPEHHQFLAALNAPRLDVLIINHQSDNKWQPRSLPTTTIQGVTTLTAALIPYNGGQDNILTDFKALKHFTVSSSIDIRDLQWFWYVEDAEERAKVKPILPALEVLCVSIQMDSTNTKHNGTWLEERVQEMAHHRKKQGYPLTTCKYFGVPAESPWLTADYITIEF